MSMYNSKIYKKLCNLPENSFERKWHRFAQIYRIENR